ncbi:unnamed protein product [Natator depressus]
MSFQAVHPLGLLIGRLGFVCLLVLRKQNDHRRAKSQRSLRNLQEQKKARRRLWHEHGKASQQQTWHRGCKDFRYSILGNGVETIFRTPPIFPILHFTQTFLKMANSRLSRYQISTSSNKKDLQNY